MESNQSVPNIPYIPKVIKKSPKAKVIVGVALVVLLMVGLLVGLNLSRQQQKLKSKASVNPIVFVESDSLTCDASGQCLTTIDNINIRLESPLGPPPDNNPIPTSTPTPALNLTPTPAPFGKPPNASASCVNNTITVTWSPVSGAIAYPVRVDDLSNPWTPGQLQAGDSADDNLKATTYTRQGEAGKRYHWWVHAMDVNTVLSDAAEGEVKCE